MCLISTDQKRTRNRSLKTAQIACSRVVFGMQPSQNPLGQRRTGTLSRIATTLMYNVYFQKNKQTTQMEEKLPNFFVIVANHQTDIWVGFQGISGIFTRFNQRRYWCKSTDQIVQSGTVDKFLVDSSNGLKIINGWIDYSILVKNLEWCFTAGWKSTTFKSKSIIFAADSRPSSSAINLRNMGWCEL